MDIYLKSFNFSTFNVVFKLVEQSLSYYFRNFAGKLSFPIFKLSFLGKIVEFRVFLELSFENSVQKKSLVYYVYGFRTGGQCNSTTRRSTVSRILTTVNTYCKPRNRSGISIYPFCIFVDHQGVKMYMPTGLQPMDILYGYPIFLSSPDYALEHKLSSSLVGLL